MKNSAIDIDEVVLKRDERITLIGFEVLLGFFFDPKQCLGIYPSYQPFSKGK